MLGFTSWAMGSDGHDELNSKIGVTGSGGIIERLRYPCADILGHTILV